MSELYHANQLPLFGQTKVCKTCNPPTEKPIEEFDRDRSKPDGHASRCKVCSHAAQSARYRKLHPPKEREPLPPVQEAERERRLASMKAYRLKHLEKERARKRVYYAEHQEENRVKQNAKYQEAVEAYRTANPLPVIREGHKICSTCRQEKPFQAFYKQSANNDGYDYYCKECKDRASGYKQVGKRRNKPSVQPGYKWCYGCESEKPLSEFGKDSTKWDGYRPRCNQCYHEYNHHRWQENREQWMPINRVRSRNLYNSNLEYYRAKSREKSRQPRYRLYAASVQSRRLAQKRTTSTEDVDFRNVIKRDGYHCYICEQPINPALKDGPARLVFDHVIPLARGGTHTEDNIKPTHRVCNERKNIRFLDEMTLRQRRGPDA